MGTDKTFPKTGATTVGMLTLVALFVACEPRVKIEAPDKPITINLNVKIEQEVRIRLEKDVEDLISTNSELF